MSMPTENTGVTFSVPSEFKEGTESPIISPPSINEVEDGAEEKKEDNGIESPTIPPESSSLSRVDISPFIDPTMNYEDTPEWKAIPEYTKGVLKCLGVASRSKSRFFNTFIVLFNGYIMEMKVHDPEKYALFLNLMRNPQACKVLDVPQMMIKGIDREDGDIKVCLTFNGIRTF